MNTACTSCVFVLRTPAMTEPTVVPDHEEEEEEEEEAVAEEEDDDEETVGPTTVEEQEDEEEAEEQWAQLGFPREEESEEEEEEEAAVEDEEEEDDIWTCEECGQPNDVGDVDVSVHVTGKPMARCAHCNASEFWPFRDRMRVVEQDRAFIVKMASQASSSSEKTSTGKGN